MRPGIILLSPVLHTGSISGTLAHLHRRSDTAWCYQHSGHGICQRTAGLSGSEGAAITNHFRWSNAGLSVHHLWKNRASCIMLIYEVSRSCFQPAIDHVQAWWQRRDAALQRQLVVTQGEHGSPNIPCSARVVPYPFCHSVPMTGCVTAENPLPVEGSVEQG